MKELRREFISHSLVTLVYFLAISLFNLSLGLELVWFWLGALLGTFLLDIDHLILGLNSGTQTEWAMKFRSFYQQKKYKEAILTLADSHMEHRCLIFHSILFQPILLILAFFVITSTGSLFGVGLVMSMNLHLLKDLWHSFLDKNSLDWFFWQIKGKIKPNVQKAYLLTVTSFFLLITLLLV